MKIHRVPDLPDSLPFCSAVEVDGLLHCSGNIGNRPGSLEVVPGGIAAETRQCMENIRSVLEYCGSSLDKVIKVTVFIDDMDGFWAMNEVYREFFTTHLPARSCVAVKALAIGAKVEIECIALAAGR
ncbi:Enamine/imine deaminase [Oceanibacterium hippocampi]|uniref:Enamine/imine deaminase n=2 Tax=Oceanibacterium hippocampi TaxID=745714 RepID=A0A1Y5S021_9PROT|nr:Enamine/imine deaminase [Oceanibacterium hippocampi]